MAVSGLPEKLAPIVLFVYNRPKHTLATLESLRANTLAPRSDLYVFSDGPKADKGASIVQAVRDVIRKASGFKSITLIERDRNFGLAASVIKGVTDVIEQEGRLVVLEDDLLTTVDFLTFMNLALERYAGETRILSVSGFNHALKAPQSYPYDAFMFYRSSSLGWGTWKDCWQKADWQVSDYNSFSSDKDRRKAFNRGGDDLANMLALQMAGEIDSWAIRWAYTHYKQDARALLSLQPRVLHIGSDGSGTYTRRGGLKQLPLTHEVRSTFSFPPAEQLEPEFVAALHKLLSPSLPRKAVRYVLRIGRRTKRSRIRMANAVSVTSARNDARGSRE